MLPLPVGATLVVARRHETKGKKKAGRIRDNLRIRPTFSREDFTALPGGHKALPYVEIGAFSYPVSLIGNKLLYSFVEGQV